MKTDSESFSRGLETGGFIMGNKAMADQLNTYFGSVFTKEDTKYIPEMLGNTGFS